MQAAVETTTEFNELTVPDECVFHVLDPYELKPMQPITIRIGRDNVECLVHKRPLRELGETRVEVYYDVNVNKHSVNKEDREIGKELYTKRFHHSVSFNKILYVGA